MLIRTDLATSCVGVEIFNHYMRGERIFFFVKIQTTFIIHEFHLSSGSYSRFMLHQMEKPCGQSESVELPNTFSQVDSLDTKLPA